MNLKLAIAASITLIASSGAVASPAAAHQPAPGVAQPLATVVTPNGAWTVYHHDGAHTGYDSTAPAATSATAGWVSGSLDGTIYGEPLVYQGVVYVATLNNTVYALNQTDGSLVWSVNVGAPQTSGWQCGNINPTGILGTGVIDTAASRIYYVGFLHQYLSYYLFGFDLATGTRVLTTQILPAGFDWTDQQQRGALALSHDGSHVYVPFGGRAGDCGAYHAWVVGLPTAGGLGDELFEGASTGAGSWAAGGVLVDDATGNVFFSTGNAIPCSGAVYSDSVIRTDASLGSVSFFQPEDWEANWCGPDSDLGSASPVLISPSLAFMAGKHGQGFLLDPTNLGGTDGQLFPARSPYTGADVCFGNHSDATFGSFAYASPRVYIECEGHGLVSLTVDTSAPSFSLCGSGCPTAGTWHAGGSATFGPPIVAGGAAWVVDINGSGLYGFDAATGTQIYHSASFGVTHFSTPSEAGGQIFVSSDTVVRSFNMAAGCRAVTVSTSPGSPQVVGTPVSVTGSASGCPNANPLYEFWKLNPGSGTWQLVQGYSTSPTFNWTTSGQPAGTYRFSVWVRDASSPGVFSNSLGTYDAFNAGQFFTLTSIVCSAVAVSASPPNSAPVGAPVTITGSASGCPNPLYQFWLLYPGSGTWQMARDYSTSPAFNWTTVAKPLGTYRFSVWARDTTSTGAFSNSLGSYDAFNAGQFFTLTPGCAAVDVSASPPSPAMTGTAVTVTGAASGCLNASPLYEFWVLYPGSGTWQLARGYSTTPTFSWATTGLPTGTYRFSVWVHDSSGPGAYTNSLGSYDAFNVGQFYTLTPGCAAVGVSASPPSPTMVGTPVNVTGSASGCLSGSPLYQFWILYPGSSTWQMARDYTTSPTYNWTTTGLPAGTYRFSVWVKNSSGQGVYSNSLGTYDAFNVDEYFTLTPGCAAVGVSASPASPATAGTPVNITGAASGCLSASPLYQFWILYPGSGTWQMARDYATSPTFNWTTTGLPAGTYRFSVWVKNSSGAGVYSNSLGTYDAFNVNQYYTLN